VLFFTTRIGVNGRLFENKQRSVANPARRRRPTLSSRAAMIFGSPVVLQSISFFARRDDFLAAASRLPNQMWGRLTTCGRLAIGQMPLLEHSSFSACRYVGQIRRYAWLNCDCGGFACSMACTTLRTIPEMV
jgi:hypothetical protein